MKNIKKPLIFVIFFIAVLFVAVPLPAADLYIRIQFTEVEGSSCALYYTTETSNNYSQDQCVLSDIDYGPKEVTFRLDGSLKDQLTGLRLDLPSVTALLCVKNITVSSAGIIQKQFNPVDFFAAENIAQMHHIEAINPVDLRDIAYILTGGDDPYLILSENLVKQITDQYSCYRLTRIGICIFAAACYFMYKKNLFHKK